MQIDLEKERLEILKRYRKLLRTAKPFLKDDDAKQIKKALKQNDIKLVTWKEIQKVLY